MAGIPVPFYMFKDFIYSKHYQHKYNHPVSPNPSSVNDILKKHGANPHYLEK